MCECKCAYKHTLIQIHEEATLDDPHMFILTNNTKGRKTNSVIP